MEAAAEGDGALPDFGAVLKATVEAEVQKSSRRPEDHKFYVEVMEITRGATEEDEDLAVVTTQVRKRKGGTCLLRKCRAPLDPLAP